MFDYKMDILSLGFTINSLMNPSNKEEINLSQITQKTYGFININDQNLENKVYNPMLIKFVKWLYENDLNKRPTASEALKMLINIQNNINIPYNNINNNYNYIANNNQISINNPQLINNINFPKIDNNIIPQQNNQIKTEFLNLNDNKENEIISSMKSLLQILYHLDEMNFIKAQISSLFSNNQINNNK